MKTSITYTNSDLSAFLVSTLAQSLDIPVKVTKNAKGDLTGKSQIFNVQMKSAGDLSIVLMGELSICDYLIAQKNHSLSKGEKRHQRVGEDLETD
jgi:hypothetical protein